MAHPCELSHKLWVCLLFMLLFYLLYFMLEWFWFLLVQVNPSKFKMNAECGNYALCLAVFFWSWRTVIRCTTYKLYVCLMNTYIYMVMIFAVMIELLTAMLLRHGVRIIFPRIMKFINIILSLSPLFTLRKYMMLS